MRSDRFLLILSCVVISSCGSSKRDTRQMEILRKFDSIDNALSQQLKENHADNSHDVSQNQRRIDSILMTIDDPDNPYLDSLKRLRHLK